MTALHETTYPVEALLLFSLALQRGLIVTASIDPDGRHMVSIEDDGDKVSTGLAGSFGEALERAAWPWRLHSPQT